jgi:cytidylate kinase
MKEQTREEPTIVAAAERQMQTWARTREIEDRSAAGAGLSRECRAVSYLAISREAGAGGSQIAKAVGHELGWNVLDKDILARVADRYNLPLPMLELVDETVDNWVSGVFGSWIDHTIISHDRYFACLKRVLRASLAQEKLVLVGRGAQFMLPREKGLAVRIVAPEQYRLSRIVEQGNVTRREAQRLIGEVDSRRQQFVRRYFHREISDPHLYDLTINVENIGVGGAVRQIITALGG